MNMMNSSAFIILHLTKVKNMALKDWTHVRYLFNPIIRKPGYYSWLTGHLRNIYLVGKDILM